MIFIVIQYKNYIDASLQMTTLHKKTNKKDIATSMGTLAMNPADNDFQGSNKV